MDALRDNVICSLLHVLNYFKTSKRYDFPSSKRQFFLGLLPFSVEIESFFIFCSNWVFFSFSVEIETSILVNEQNWRVYRFQNKWPFFYVATHHKWYHWKWQDIIELNDWLHDSLQITRKLLTEQDSFFLALIEIGIKCTSDHYTMAH